MADETTDVAIYYGPREWVRGVCREDRHKSPHPRWLRATAAALMAFYPKPAGGALSLARHRLHGIAHRIGTLSGGQRRQLMPTAFLGTAAQMTVTLGECVTGSTGRPWTFSSPPPPPRSGRQSRGLDIR